MKSTNKGSAKFIFSLAFFLVLMISSNMSTSIYSQNNPSIEKQITPNKNLFVITKNTTKLELDSIIRSMEEVGLILQYKNLGYNSNEEITSISLIYKSKNYNSGKYNVSSKKPINDIIISINQNNVSISSRGAGNQTMSSQSSHPNFHRQREKDIPSMEDKRTEMHQKMKNRREYANKRRKIRSAQIEERRKQIRKNSHSDRSRELDLAYQTITKNSTQTDLISLKKMYAEEGISFSYRDLERNSNGEIVRIYITINNRNGTISTTSFGNGTVPIHDILLGVDSNNVIVKNKKQP